MGTDTRFLDPKGAETGGNKRRFLGIHLAGAKSDRTCMVVFDVFDDDENSKHFLVDVVDRISANELGEAADENLISSISDLNGPVTAIGMDAPLTLPPCLTCTLPCPGTTKCEVPEVKWLRQEQRTRIELSRKGKRVKPIAPYVERPVDVYLRSLVGGIVKRLEEEAERCDEEKKKEILSEDEGKSAESAFEETLPFVNVTEAIGATTAMRAARATFLKKHLIDEIGNPISLYEVNPTLSIAALKDGFSLYRRDLRLYRSLSQGAQIRLEILDRLNEQGKVFLYQRDVETLVGSLPAFDAFICAYTAFLADSGETESEPEMFPRESGWVEIPRPVSNP